MGWLIVFGFADVIAAKLAKLMLELTDDDCGLLVCGCLCQPCLIAQVLEEVGENWWFTCATVLAAPHLLGIPYICCTAPVSDLLNLGPDFLLF